jgi:hypothetical protein
MNRFERRSPTPGEAVIEYLDGDFRVVRPGSFAVVLRRDGRRQSD